jgi:D-alanine-D-alanine ligase
MNKWTQRNVVVVYGGESSEREISLRTGAALADALRERGVDARLLDLRRGRLGDLAALKPDVVLIALHGNLGEDGALQGVLEWMDVPYTGSGVLASALAMDKLRTKEVLAARGVPTPRWTVAAPSAEEPTREIGLPCVVKPSLEGSSVGVSIVRDAAGWRDAIRRCAGTRGDLLVEELIVGRELTVAIRDGQTMGVIEVMPAETFYDYEAKYQRNDTRYVFPAALSPAVQKQVESVAERAYSAVGCRGVARVDVMLSQDESPFVLEVNTIPGMTATSLVPKVAAGIGIAFPDFAVSMLDAATTDARALLIGGAR